MSREAESFGFAPGLCEKVMDEQTLLLTISGLFLTTLATSVANSIKTTKSLAKHERVIVEIMAAHEIKDMERFSKTSSEIVTASDDLSRNFGEVAQALRQKISDVELWGRDNYVKNPMFEKAIEEIRDLVKATKGHAGY